MGFLEYKLSGNGKLGGNPERTPERKPARGAGLYNGRYVTLPQPTPEPVNKEQYYRFLDYDPDNGPGDVGNYLSNDGDPEDAVDEAEETARRLVPGRGYDDAQDAVRHALGSYLLVKKYGVRRAKEITDGHERASFPLGYIGLDDDNDQSELQDLYNNRVGRDAAGNLKNKGRNPEDVIMELFREGKLQSVPFALRR
ncbi:DUF6973 domain-containing protein [Kiloniella laminariae]|uniref:DUF6973 domain-containing protein n=1 Tax=Kiloniella laminariae TaxID=454162 RepID=UPI000365437A|nr:hypothetical protein [Kiloniella laminariae]